MREVERQFDYNEPTGMLRLLGVLCIILAPLTLWLSRQDDPGGDGLWLIGKGFFAYIPQPLVPYAMAVISVLLVWIAWALIKGAGQQKKFGGRIAFTSTGFIYESGPPVGSEIEYGRISNIRVSGGSKRKVLTFNVAGDNKRVVDSSNMRSIAEFDEMAALLRQHVESKAAVEQPVA